jgi:hypothetical protein
MALTNRFTGLKPFTPLLIAIPILMVVSIIELSFVSAMVGFLHGRANGFFLLNVPGNDSPSGPNTLELWAKPENLLEDQGHTSNGAAGTGFVAVGFGGLLMIWWERRRMRLVYFPALGDASTKHHLLLSMNSRKRH